MAQRTSPAFWVFILFVVIGHFTLHLALGLGAGAPDLLTVALLLSVRRLKSSTAAAVGLVLGLLNDGVAGAHYGAEALVMTVLGYIGARSRDLFEGDSLLFVGVYLFLGKWLHDLGYYLLTGGVGQGDFVSHMLTLAPVAALYAAGGGIAGMLIYRAATGER